MGELPEGQGPRSPALPSRLQGTGGQGGEREGTGPVANGLSGKGAFLSAVAVWFWLPSPPALSALAPASCFRSFRGGCPRGSETIFPKSMLSWRLGQTIR